MRSSYYPLQYSVSDLQPNQISMDENILVSRYINNPLLIDGELLEKQLLYSI